MNRVDFIDLLRGAAGLNGTPVAQVDTELWVTLRDGMSRRLEMGWEEEFWPEWTVVEERYFAPMWDPAVTYGQSTLAAGVWVYYPPTGLYYQSIRANNLLSRPANGAGVTQLDWWADVKSSFSAEQWVYGDSYEVGDQVEWEEGGQCYQCHTAHTAGVITPADTTKWGILVPFDRLVAYEQSGKTALGTVRACWDRHPDRGWKAAELTFATRATGVVVRDGVTKTFVEFRKRSPRLWGDVFSATATYAVGEQVYFPASGSETATYRGNFYDCAEATSAGESPSTAAAKWTLVEIPRVLSRFLELGALADCLTANGMQEKAWAAAGLARLELERAVGIFRGQSGQRGRTTVLTR